MTIPKCDKCKVDLEVVKAYEPYWDDHYQCPQCDGTYNIWQFCELCGLNEPYYLRDHHLTPRSKGGKDTARVCETCESYIHKTWTHNQLRDIFNSVETILADEGFQKFLKWRRKQPATVLFKSSPGKFRDKRKYT